MHDHKSLKNLEPSRKEAWLWALVFFVCIMLPGIMYPGNLGPIAIYIGFISFGLPALVIGFNIGKFVGSPHIANRLILATLGLIIFLFMFNFVKTH